MELTQKDFDERVARHAAGNATDEDIRLIDHYQAQGFTPKQGDEDANADSQGDLDNPGAAEHYDAGRDKPAEDATVTELPKSSTRARK